jgi:hypothetical protein
MRDRPARGGLFGVLIEGYTVLSEAVEIGEVVVDALRRHLTDNKDSLSLRTLVAKA